MSEPVLISVVLPVYNGELYLREAIDSILNQTLQDFELIVVNDGSTDQSAAILDTYIRSESRVKVITQPNQGLAIALNVGLQAANGIYIARMDQDDIALPERFAEQIAYMEAHPSVGICGTWVETIGEYAGLIWRYPVDHPTIRCRLLFESVLAHPTVMFRRKLFADHDLWYDPAYPPGEDYDLWVRASVYCELANIPKILLHYRTHSTQMTRQHGLLAAPMIRVRLHQLERLGLTPTPEELELHHALVLGQVDISKEQIERVDTWLSKLQAANRIWHIYPEPVFSRLLGGYWFDLCRTAVAHGMRRWIWFRYWRSPLSRSARPDRRRLLRFTRNALCRR